MKALSAAAVALVVYRVALNPISFVVGFIAGFTAQTIVHYPIDQHPENPINFVITILSALASAAVAVVITRRLYRRVWPSTNSLKTSN